MEETTKVILDQKKQEITKQLKDLQAKEITLAKELDTTRANINGLIGAIQYHDYLVTTLEKENSENSEE